MRSGENGPSETNMGRPARFVVNSPSRTTLENNGKIRPQPDRENAFAGASGGGGGIRTHGTLSRTPVFKTGAFDHSATPPGQAHLRARGSILKAVSRFASPRPTLCKRVFRRPRTRYCSCTGSDRASNADRHHQSAPAKKRRASEAERAVMTHFPKWRTRPAVWRTQRPCSRTRLRRRRLHRYR
jgi:hypothetical protein